MWAVGKTAYCQGGVTPQLVWDEVRQKVSQVKGGSYAGLRRGDWVSEGRSKNHSFPQRFPHTPTSPPLAYSISPPLKALFSPDTPSEPFLCNAEVVTFTWKGLFLCTTYSLVASVYLLASVTIVASVHLLADVVENVVGQVEVFQVLRPDKDLGAG